MIVLVRLLQRDRTNRMEITMKERKRGAGGERFKVKELCMQLWKLTKFAGWAGKLEMQERVHAAVQV